MKAWMLAGIGRLELREVPYPVIERADDVMVRVTATGVCGSDVHYYKEGRIGDQVVKFPFAIGHECAGRVEKAGVAVNDLKPGDEVAVEPAVSCMECDQCRAGRFHTCRRLQFLGCPGQMPGCLAEFIVMPRRNLFPLDAATGAERAAAAEPLSIGIYAVKRAGKFSRTAVLGAGPIGLCLMKAAREAGAEKVYVTDKLAYRAGFARRLGADDPGNMAEGLDAVFECCGDQGAIDQAVMLLKPGGVLAIVGIPAEDRISLPVHEIRRREIDIVNVRRQVGCMEAAVGMIEKDCAFADALITHRFKFGNAPAAFEMVSGYKDGVIKAVIGGR